VKHIDARSLERKAPGWPAARRGAPTCLLPEAGATTFLWRDTCRSLTAPVYHLCRDPAQADRMRPWFSHPKPKVDVCPNAGHWIMQDRKDDVNAAATAWIDAL
jgi:pimeloyl-ACP methyl ester carboxylesterase